MGVSSAADAQKPSGQSGMAVELGAAVASSLKRLPALYLSRLLAALLFAADEMDMTVCFRRRCIAPGKFSPLCRR